MGDVIGTLLPLAVAVAISPQAITAMIIILLQSARRVLVVAFLAGWLGSTFAVTAVGYDVARLEGAGTILQPSASSAWLQVLLGALMVLFAARRWADRPTDGYEDRRSLPSWLHEVDKVSAPLAAGQACVVGGLGPKNFFVSIAAGFAVARGELPIVTSLAITAAFAVAAGFPLLAPVVASAVAADRARMPLIRAKDWLIAYGNVIQAVVLLMIGAVVVGGGVVALT